MLHKMGQISTLYHSENFIVMMYKGFTRSKVRLKAALVVIFQPSEIKLLPRSFRQNECWNEVRHLASVVVV